MALGATLTSYISQTTIASATANGNQNNLNAVENPTFTLARQTAGTQGTGEGGGTLTNTTASLQGALATTCPLQRTNTPTSITIGAAEASANASAPTTFSVSVRGFRFGWTSSGGQSTYQAQWTTVGN